MSRILSLGTLRIRVDLLYISSATHGGILIMYRRYNYQIIAQLQCFYITHLDMLQAEVPLLQAILAEYWLDV